MRIEIVHIPCGTPRLKLRRRVSFLGCADETNLEQKKKASIFYFECGSWFLLANWI